MRLKGPSIPHFILIGLVFSLTVLNGRPLWAAAESPPEPFPSFRTAIGVRGANGFTADADVGSGFGGDVFLLRHLTGPVWVEVSAGLLRGSIQANPERFSGGDYRTMPLALGLRVTPFKERVMPYLALGVDYVAVSYDPDASVMAAWQQLGFTTEESVDSTFGVHFGAGILIPVSRTLYLNLEGRYTAANTSGTWRIRDMRSGVATEGSIDDVKLGGFAVRYGIALAF